MRSSSKPHHKSKLHEIRQAAPGHEQADPPLPSQWEWVVAAIGALLIAGIIGYLAYFGWTQDKTPPTIEASVTQVYPTPGGYAVRIRATNGGGSTAAAVRIAGDLRRNGEVVETS